MRADKKLIGKVGKYNPVITEEGLCCMNPRGSGNFQEEK
jgi:hypothetical protein